MYGGSFNSWHTLSRGPPPPLVLRNLPESQPIGHSTTCTSSNGHCTLVSGGNSLSSRFKNGFPNVAVASWHRVRVNDIAVVIAVGVGRNWIYCKFFHCWQCCCCWCVNTKRPEACPCNHCLFFLALAPCPLRLNQLISACWTIRAEAPLQNVWRCVVCDGSWQSLYVGGMCVYMWSWTSCVKTTDGDHGQRRGETHKENRKTHPCRQQCHSLWRVK